MYNKETLKQWKMTEEECEKATREITIKGMRLTYEEKENLLFYFMEGYISRDDIDSQIALVEDMRKDAEELKEIHGKVREFAKEVRRLERKYDMENSDIAEKSLDELADMWMTNYFELYFMDTHYDCLEENPKQYAQYYCYNVGICPESEVSMWRD